MLAESDEWGLDGTFCKPDDVMQRVVIVPKVPRIPGGSEKVPMTAAVAYTERRRTKDYERIFQRIKECLPPDRQRVRRWLVMGNPLQCYRFRRIPIRSTLSDMEQATRKAAEKIFPESRIVYCSFHVTKSTKEAEKDLRLRHHRGEPPYDIFMRGLRSLSYLPPDEVVNGAVELLRRFTPFINSRSALEKAKLTSRALLFPPRCLCLTEVLALPFRVHQLL